jgi:hypothetical protein
MKFKLINIEFNKMSSQVSNKINQIFNRLRDSPYTGDLHNKHFAVAIRNGKQISPVICNYFRSNVFGKVRGSIHSEMGTVSYVLNTDQSHYGYCNHRIKESYVLPPKGILKVA